MSEPEPDEDGLDPEADEDALAILVISDRDDGADHAPLRGAEDPHRTSKTLAVGPGFESSPWNTGDDYDNGADPEAVRIDRSAGRKYRRNQDLAEMTKAGHGFAVRVLGNVDLRQYPTCRYCGTVLVTSDRTYVCEFAEDYDEHCTGWEYGRSGPVRVPRIVVGPAFYGVRKIGPGRFDIGGILVTRCRSHNRVPIDVAWDESVCDVPPDWMPDTLARQADPRPPITDGPCRCIPCTIREDVARSVGAEREICSFPACKARQEDEQKERERLAVAAKREAQKERERALAAIELLIDPERSNKAIATLLGIRPVRVKEARKKLSGLIY